MPLPFASLSPAQQQLLFSQAQQLGVTPLAYLNQIQSSGVPVAQALQTQAQTPSAQSATNANYIANQTAQYDANVGNQAPAANATAGVINNIINNDFLGYQTTGSNYNTDPSQYAGAGENRTDNASANAVGNALVAPGAINAVDASSQGGKEALGELTGNDNATDSTFDKAMEALSEATVAFGGGAILAPVAAAGAAGAGLTGTAAGVAAGAGTGATVGAGIAGLTGQNVGKGALTGALSGGLNASVPGLGGALSTATGGALGPAASDAIVGAGAGALTSVVNGGNPLIGALGGAASGAIRGSGITNTAGEAINGATGLPTSIGAGLTGAVLGSGVGAVTGALGNNGAGNGALTGAFNGGLSAGVSNATGSTALGNVAGTIGSDLVGKYLTAPSTPQSPATPVPAAPSAAQPATATTQPISTAIQAPAPTPAPTTTPSNIGSYSGFSSTGLGYQPRQQVNPGITNYNTYGQGPEAQFYQPTPGTT